MVKKLKVLVQIQKGEIILDKTPFYAESGGQIGDKGIISLIDDEATAEVKDVKERSGLIIHIINQKSRWLNLLATRSSLL